MLQAPAKSEPPADAKRPRKEDDKVREAGSHGEWPLYPTSRSIPVHRDALRRAAEPGKRPAEKKNGPAEKTLRKKIMPAGKTLRKT